MTAVASEGVPGKRHQLRQRLRSTVLGDAGLDAAPRMRVTREGRS